MYPALLHSHSGLRWILLVLLLVSVVTAFNRYMGKKPMTAMDKKLSLFTLISTHLQAVLGFGLYFMSHKVEFSSNTMSNSMIRFFTMEHTVMMLIAIILITIGNRNAKKGNAKGVFWCFFIALVVILAAIPWPFRATLGGQWF